MDSTNSKDNNRQQISEAELKKLKLLLEKEGEDKVKELNSSNIVNDPNKMLESLTKIMKDGEKEFVKKTGRRMTYGEMREMYG
jgi:ribosomal protein L15